VLKIGSVAEAVLTPKIGLAIDGYFDAQATRS